MPATLNGGSVLSIVLIDDDPHHLDLLESSVRSAADDGRPAVVSAFTSPEEAIANLGSGEDAFVFIDHCLSDSVCLDWLPDIVRLNVGPVVVMTSAGDGKLAAQAFRQGAADYVLKEDLLFHPDRVRATIDECLRRYRLERSNRDLMARLRAANRELERKNRKLAELTDTAHRFVDDVAHEFRTPLAVIQEFASIISDGLGGEVSDKQAEYLDYITDGSRNLASLIDDFLDSSKIRSQTLRVDRRRTSVVDVFAPVWKTVESRAKLRRITVVNELTDELPHVFVDPDKARRTLINLVVNAIKFSNPDTEVRVSAEIDDRGFVRVSVTDQGPGIPPEGVSDLFERFRQAGQASGGIKGFGLGLSIVRDLVSVNLGDTSVSSRLGEGSRFSFTLPIHGQGIVMAYLDALQRRTDRTGRIAALRATSSSQDVVRLAAELAHATHATDLVWPAVHDSSVVLAGDCNDAEGWMRRLQAWASSQSQTEVLGDLQFELIGVSPTPHAERLVRPLLFPELGG